MSNEETNSIEVLKEQIQLLKDDLSYYKNQLSTYERGCIEYQLSFDKGQWYSTHPKFLIGGETITEEITELEIIQYFKNVISHHLAERLYSNRVRQLYLQLCDRFNIHPDQSIYDTEKHFLEESKKQKSEKSELEDLQKQVEFLKNKTEKLLNEWHEQNEQIRKLSGKHNKSIEDTIGKFNGVKMLFQIAMSGATHRQKEFLAEQALLVLDKQIESFGKQWEYSIETKPLPF